MRADARFVLFPQFLERKFNDMSEEIEIKDEVLDLKVTDKYDENQIQVLEGLEAVRKRPGMYIGSTSARGLHHLVYEIVDNSIDEALAGYCTHIEVTIEKGDIIRVADNGRGIPCGIHPQMGIPTLEVVLTVLHAGGKFDGSGYKVSGGLHGVGSSVVNALSDWLEAEVRDGHTKHYMRFERGVTTVKMRDTPCESETGTTIRFHADPEIFETTIYEYDVLEKRLREQAFLNAGLKITLRDERDDEPVEEVMHYEGGIRQFVEHLNRTKTPLHENVIYMEGSRDTSMAEVAMQYTDSYSELMLSFANNINTTEGGTHETGFKAALTRVLNDYGKKYKLLKDDESFKGEDAREGLTAIISVKLQDIAKLTDVFYIGGTKCGALCGEAVVFTHGNMPKQFVTMVKRRGAMIAKGRLNALQFDALFTDGLYEKICAPAVKLAIKLRDGLKAKGYRFALESPTNQQFIIVENSRLPELQSKVVYSFIEKYDAEHTVIRLATSWATTEEQVDELLSIL